MFLLADGASGAGREGKVLMSQTCVEVAEHFDYTSSGLTPIQYIDALFTRINTRLIELSHQHHSRLFGTVIIALVDENTLTATTFGDSPIYLYQKGVVKRLARNKRRYEELIESGYITYEQYEGYISQMPDRMQTCFDYFLPEVVPNNVIEQYSLEEGDMVILCCDGLSDWLTPEQIFANLKDCELPLAVDSLIQTARDISLQDHGSYDDITAIAVLCG